MERKIYQIAKQQKSNRDKVGEPKKMIGLEKKYRSVMEDHIKKGYARKLSAVEALNSGPRTWYLPHLPVMKPE